MHFQFSGGGSHLHSMSGVGRLHEFDVALMAGNKFSMFLVSRCAIATKASSISRRAASSLPIRSSWFPLPLVLK